MNNLEDPKNPVQSTSAIQKERKIIKMDCLSNEVLLILASYLDTASMLNMYSVSDRWRDVINTPGVFNIKGNMDSANAVFKSPVLKNELVHNVRVLNLTNVTDMDEECTKTIAAMTNLRKANFSFSNLTLHSIIAAMPESAKEVILTLTARDFNLFGNFTIDSTIIMFIAQFETMDLKFFSSFGMSESKMFIHFLCLIKCPHIKITYFYRTYSVIPILEMGYTDPNFKELTFKCAYENSTKIIIMYLYKFTMPLWKNIEYLLWNIDSKNDTFKVIMSPTVMNVLIENQHVIRIKESVIVVVENIDVLTSMRFKGQVILFMWDSVQIENINEKIYKTLKRNLFSYSCVHGVANEILVNTNNDRVALYHLNNFIKEDEAVWDLDLYVHPGTRILTIGGMCICDWTSKHAKIDLMTSGIRKVIPVGKSWSRIKFLQIHQIDLDEGFWSYLLQQTEKLETLTVTGCALYPTTNYIGISQNINKCKSLKNFKIHELNIDAKVLFKGLSKCPNLEVVNVDTINNFENILYAFGEANKDESLKAREVVQLQSEIIKMIQFCNKLDTLVIVNLLHGVDRAMRHIRKTITTAALIYNTNLTLLFYNRSANAPNKSSHREKFYLFYPDDIFFD